MFKIPFIFRNYNNIILAEGFELMILNLKNDKYNLLPLEQIQYLLKKKLQTYTYCQELLYTSSIPRILMYIISGRP